jgi:hypothetical protein
MLKLCVTRLWFTDKSTIGKLYLDGVYECFTLEPGDPKELIPCGIFILRLLPSEKFKRYMPFIIGVPDHTAEEIHIGDDPQDTKGCTVVGQTRGDGPPPWGEDWVGNSTLAFNELMSKLDASQDMSIEYREERALAA